MKSFDVNKLVFECSMKWGPYLAMFFPRELCCSNFVLTALFDIHSSNFRSKSWNSKYRVAKPSPNAAELGDWPLDSFIRA